MIRLHGMYRLVCAFVILKNEVYIRGYIAASTGDFGSLITGEQPILRLIKFLIQSNDSPHLRPFSKWEPLLKESICFPKGANAFL